MSHSYRKNFIFAVCQCKSQKQWKKEYNRIYRSKSKALLHKSIINNNIDYNIGNVYKQAFADIWKSPSDGKIRCVFLTEDEFNNSRVSDFFISYNEYLKEFKINSLSK